MRKKDLEMDVIMQQNALDYSPLLSFEKSPYEIILSLTSDLQVADCFFENPGLTFQRRMVYYRMFLSTRRSFLLIVTNRMCSGSSAG